MPNSACGLPVASVASYQFNVAVISAELVHLLDGRMCKQLSLCTLFEFAVNSLIMGVPVCQQTLCESRPCQTLGDDKGIVPERFKKFLQHVRLLRVLCHPIHFSL